MTPLAAIHAKKKALGLDDDTYRAMLERLTGKRSAKDMSPSERAKVVAEMDRQGAAAAPAQRRSNGARTALQGPFAKKLQALWIAGWNLGLIRNRDDAAMLAFVERQTGIANTRFLVDTADARKAVEALKDWLAREGGVSWREHAAMSATDRMPGYKIARVQWARLEGAFFFPAFKAFCEDRALRPLPQMTAREWVGIMNTLGERLRAKLAAEGAAA